MGFVAADVDVGIAPVAQIAGICDGRYIDEAGLAADIGEGGSSREAGGGICAGIEARRGGEEVEVSEIGGGRCADELGIDVEAADECALDVAIGNLRATGLLLERMKAESPLPQAAQLAKTG